MCLFTNHLAFTRTRAVFWCLGWRNHCWWFHSGVYFTWANRVQRWLSGSAWCLDLFPCKFARYQRFFIRTLRCCFLHVSRLRFVFEKLANVWCVCAIHCMYVCCVYLGMCDSVYVFIVLFADAYVPYCTFAGPTVAQACVAGTHSKRASPFKHS